MKISDQKIYHTYQIGNKVKNITSLSGLKRFSTVNKNNKLTFQELLKKNNFEFYHNLVGKIDNHCRLCGKELPIFRIIENKKKVLLALCSCSVQTPLCVNRTRFLSILPEEKVDTVYDAYCQNKMRKWTTKGIPVASLDFKIQKFGKEEGRKRYEKVCKSMDSSSINFFMLKGFSKEEAVKLSKKRQATFTKDKCIVKYGNVEGLKVWQARQKKWQTTLSTKPIEEIERINQDKIWKSGNISKISQKLFEQIDCLNARWGKRREGNAGELYVRTPTHHCMVDFCVNGKIIEFFGDYWHANPVKYKSTHVIIRRTGTKLVEDIWREDSNRILALRGAGYEVMIVWELDFKNDPERVIQECKNFLNK